jgi:hypothetical protein
MDIDHILDYYLQNGITLKIKKIYFWYAHNQYRFLFVYLHSLELVTLFWLGISIFKLGIFWVALAVGVTQHIVLDLIFNKDTVYSYSYLLSYRLIKKFKKEDLLRDFGPDLEI